MDNSSYRSQYISSTTARMSEESARGVENFWKRVARVEREIGKTLEEGYTREQYIDLMERMRLTKPHTFLPTKSSIGGYLQALRNDGLLDSEYVDTLYAIRFNDIDPSNVFDSKYFKSFADLQSSIEDTLYAADKVDDGVFDIQISAIYCAWMGLSIEEALQIKKADVEDECVRLADRTITPNSAIMHFLCNFRDATEYQSQAAAIIRLKYAESQWLFRTPRSEHVESPKTMRIFIRNFWKSAGDGTKIFNYDKIYWSGIFSRAYEYEQKHGEIQSGNTSLLEEVFNEKYSSGSVANERLREYHAYRRHFFQNGENENSEEL